ncbi:hypothetical protein GCM10022200_25350 [Microbacterium awajiense]|uniref:ATP-binding protein n=1 Tax=Microbacterium awajiense TaxID=415214 RepID=A0ABP7AVJ6_9MICO
MVGIVQLIATWANRDPERVVHSYIDPSTSDDELRRTLCDEPQLLIAAVVARTVLSSRGIDITRRLKALAREASAQAADDPAFRRVGHASFLAYEDPRTRWTSVAAPLYDSVRVRDWMWDPQAPPVGWPYPANRPPRVLRGSAFASWLRRLTSELIRNADAAIPDVAFSSIAVALSETFDNADQWGRSLTIEQSSFRLLRMEWASRTPKELSALGAGDAVINGYARRAGTRGTQFHAEYSVVDGGPGIYFRRLQRLGLHENSARAQFDVMRSVIADGVTDDPGGAGEERGRGFTHIFEALTDLKGAVRIRTGRLALSRDFEANPFRQEESARPSIFDSMTGSEEPTEHPSVCGTSVTLIVPTRKV